MVDSSPTGSEGGQNGARNGPESGPKGGPKRVPFWAQELAALRPWGSEAAAMGHSSRRVVSIGRRRGRISRTRAKPPPGVGRFQLFRPRRRVFSSTPIEGFARRDSGSQNGFRFGLSFGPKSDPKLAPILELLFCFWGDLGQNGPKWPKGPKRAKLAQMGPGGPDEPGGAKGPPSGATGSPSGAKGS